jgi:hypothetical protein
MKRNDEFDRFCRTATRIFAPRWLELPEQLVLPQVQRGVDYGVPRPVLLQKGNRCLVVEPGHSHWAGRGERTYGPTGYELQTMDGQYEPAAKPLFTGRLSKAKLAAVAPRIAEWLGCSVEELPPIHRRKTYVWSGP